VRHRAWVNNLLVTVLGLILFAALNARSGRVEANDGLGWDGRQYAHMVTARITDGTAWTVRNRTPSRDTWATARRTVSGMS